MLNAFYDLIIILKKEDNKDREDMFQWIFILKI